MKILVYIIYMAAVCVATAADNAGSDQEMQTLVLEIQVIRREMEELKRHHMSEMNIMKNEVLALKKRMDQVDEEKQIQRRQNDFLRKEMMKARKEKLILKRRFQAHLGIRAEKVKDAVFKNSSGSKIHTKQQPHQNAKTMISSQRDDVKDNRERSITSHYVAFFATLTNNSLHLGVNQIIAFDNAITNIGSAYNSHHGIFVAPVAGIYLFSVTLFEDRNHGSWFHFVKNNQIIAKLELAIANNHQTSHTVILEMDIGDDVAVKNTVSDSSVHGDKYASFCGVLLFEYTAGPAIVGK